MISTNLLHINLSMKWRWWIACIICNWHEIKAMSCSSFSFTQIVKSRRHIILFHSLSVQKAYVSIGRTLCTFVCIPCFSFVRTHTASNTKTKWNGMRQKKKKTHASSTEIFKFCVRYSYALLTLGFAREQQFFHTKTSRRSTAAVNGFECDPKNTILSTDTNHVWECFLIQWDNSHRTNSQANETDSTHIHMKVSTNSDKTETSPNGCASEISSW